MKQHITPEDLAQLTESQKMNLRDMWMPELNTLACASICRDVINEKYEDIAFVIGQVIIHEGSKNPVLRRLGLVDETIDEDGFSDEDEGEENFEDILEDSDENYEDENFEFEYPEPDQYFSKKDCLPLLSIGQMLEMLSSLKYGQYGLTVSLPPAKRLIGDKGFTVSNNLEQEYEEEELCDALWNALKAFL
jgi:hypothetical protein